MKADDYYREIERKLYPDYREQESRPERSAKKEPERLSGGCLLFLIDSHQARTKRAPKKPER